jgi:hypothetical protein
MESSKHLLLRAFLFGGERREVLMVLIRVQYDAYNRQFKLLDRELLAALEDGETYVLIADVSVEDLRRTAISDVASELEDACSPLSLVPSGLS